MIQLVEVSGYREVCGRAGVLVRGWLRAAVHWRGWGRESCKQGWVGGHQGWGIIERMVRKG